MTKKKTTSSNRVTKTKAAKKTTAKTTKKTNTKSTRKRTTKVSKTTVKTPAASVDSAPQTTMPLAQLWQKLSQMNVLIPIGVILLVMVLYLLRGQVLVATVNGQPIFRTTLIQKLEDQYGQETLDIVITEMLIKQEANKQGVKITNEEIEQTYQEMADSFTAQGQDLAEILALQGLTTEQVKEQIRLQKMVEQLAAQDVSVTDEEVAQYTEDNKEFLPQEEDEAEQKESVREALQQQKTGEQIQTWLGELRSEAKINYLLFEEPVRDKALTQ